MIDFTRLISPKFIFSISLSNLSPAFAIFFYIFFGLIVVFAISAFIQKKKYKKEKNVAYYKLWQKLADNALFFGVSGFVLLFFRQQRAYFLSMPFFWYLWFIYLVYEIYKITNWAKTRMPKIIEENKKREELKKYV